MASFYSDLDEIQRIVLYALDVNDGSIQSWEDISEEDSDDPSAAENTQDQDLADGTSETEQLPSTSGSHVRTSVNNRAQRRNRAPEINWGELDEVTNVDYPEFLGLEHGPVENFAVDSDPVVFFDKIFTDELWDLLVTEANRYAGQASATNWQDTTRD